MIRTIGVVLLTSIMLFDVALSQEAIRYKLAMVALTGNPDVRVEFEDGLAEKFRASNYDAVTSYDIIPEVKDLDDADVVRRLSEAGIQGVVMIKPAAVGPGSTLESVKGDVSNEVYSNRSFAREISPSHQDDELVAVIHTAIYLIMGSRTQLLSSGGVWLDQVETQEEGI